jgi:predicted proteasome-type protease
MLQSPNSFESSWQQVRRQIEENVQRAEGHERLALEAMAAALQLIAEQVHELTKAFRQAEKGGPLATWAEESR